MEFFFKLLFLIPTLYELFNSMEVFLFAMFEAQTIVEKKLGV
jgi:hypothetical protein